MDTINFTRGVPANESFPIDEVASAASDALKARGAAMLQYGPSLGFQPLREWLAGVAGRDALDRVLTGNGSLQLIEFLCLRPAAAGRRGVHRDADLRPHDHAAAPPRREGCRHPARGRRPEHRGARGGARRSTCRSSSTSSRTSRIRRARPARATKRRADRRAGRAARTS